MVRQIKSIFEGIEPEARNRRRHSIGPPPDNIGVSCTVQSKVSEERSFPGRRRSLVVPRDNIGIACLSTMDRLDNILELPESDCTDDDIGKKTTSKKNDETPNSNFCYERSGLCKRRDTIGLLWQKNDKEPLKKYHENKNKSDHKCQDDLGISNVRRPKDDPTKPRKLIRPRDNIGFGCKPLYKIPGRLIGSRLSTSVNCKNSSRFIERKNCLHEKSLQDETRNDEKTKEQIDTLRTVSRLSILLLYMHFLLTYYLSYAKNHRYAEIFDSCPLQDFYE